MYAAINLLLSGWGTFIPKIISRCYKNGFFNQSRDNS